MRDALAYLAAALVAAWGVLHAVPTRQVVAGFQPTSVDNTRIIVQEWLAEALTMWGVAAIVAAATAAGSVGTANWLYRASAVFLLAVAALTALTGARTTVVWFKICPVVLTVSAGLLLAASFA